MVLPCVGLVVLPCVGLLLCPPPAPSPHGHIRHTTTHNTQLVAHVVHIATVVIRSGACTPGPSCVVVSMPVHTSATCTCTCGNSSLSLELDIGTRVACMPLASTRREAYERESGLGAHAIAWRIRGRAESAVHPRRQFYLVDLGDLLNPHPRRPPLPSFVAPPLDASR